MEREVMSIGERIKRARMMAGLTQAELGNKLGLGLRQIQNIEKGETGVTIDRLEELSKTLNVPFSYFLTMVQNGEETSFDAYKDGLGQKTPLRIPVDGIVCEYIRNEETLRLIFPSSISTEDMKEKVEVLVKGIFGARIQEKE
jgi:transcriptional regulator with XRE-family HTH domain